MIDEREGAAPPDYVDVTEEFWPLAAGWFAAAMDDDEQWFNENLADEFVFLLDGGAVEPKDRSIAINRLVQNRTYALETMIARRYGTTVLARGVYYVRGDMPQGAAPDFEIKRYAAGMRVRFSTVWVERGGALRCVMFQSVALASA